MRTLTVNLAERSYPIYIGSQLYTRDELFEEDLRSNKVVVVTNEVVAPLYLPALRARLQAKGVQCVEIVLPDGEGSKSWSTLNTIFDALLSNRCERKTPLIALGGGVIGDLTGFAAATYQRGVPFIQIPTTLLSQVDSAVGGKTAINHPMGKNMIGAFYQPQRVLADIDTLRTLPQRELAAGLAEVIKYGFIRDATFLTWLEDHIDALNALEPESLAFAVERSCWNKAQVVGEDERETAGRALLNFGHTFGHAIEAGMGYGVWLHGEAVAAGMVMAARLSQKLGFITQHEVQRLVDILQRAKLPVAAPALGVERYLEYMGHDKKVQAGRVHFILLRSLGEAFMTNTYEEAALYEVLRTPDLLA